MRGGGACSSQVIGMDVELCCSRLLRLGQGFFFRTLIRTDRRAFDGFGLPAVPT